MVLVRGFASLLQTASRGLGASAASFSTATSRFAHVPEAPKDPILVGCDDRSVGDSDFRLMAITHPILPPGRDGEVSRRQEPE